MGSVPPHPTSNPVCVSMKDRQKGEEPRNPARAAGSGRQVEWLPDGGQPSVCPSDRQADTLSLSLISDLVSANEAGSNLGRSTSTCLQSTLFGCWFGRRFPDEQVTWDSGLEFSFRQTMNNF